MKLDRRRSMWQTMLLAILSIVTVVASARAAETDLRLHLAWGGGSERAWRGRISINAGWFEDLRLLGMDPDGPGAILLLGPQILINHSRGCSYDGFEVTVRSSDEAELRIELLARDESQARVISIPLRELRDGYRSEPLDDQNNRLVVRRAPGDSLRIVFDRPHLVFAPGELLPIEVLPHQLNLPAGSHVRLALRLQSSTNTSSLWDESQSLRADEQGALSAPQPVTVPLPLAEGVYDLEATLSSRRRATPFAAEKLIARHRVQLVVVGEQADATSATEEARLVVELDPTQSNWWQRLTRLPQWSLLPGFRAEGPLGNVKTEVIQRAGQSWTSLPVGGWQAYPLPIDEVGVPHELDLDFPSDQPQTLAISIVEPNAAGKIVPIGLDTGIHLSDEDITGIAAPPRSPRHRLIFWPRTTSPLVLLTNLSGEQSAVYGRFRVSRAAHLKPLPATSADHRQVIAFFERPLFAECFHATESLDPETGRSLEDWRTFLDGGERLVRYMRHVGYDGLAIACVSEGSALFDSPRLQPTPKHDRGVFFGSGQDPIRKDVLEMLFRLCDREGLTLIPVVEFATPLPALERLRHAPGENLAGMDLVDASGVRWVERNGVRRGKAAYYNPLDSRVQRAMADIINEIVQRYADHSSFGGVAINLHPDGYTQLPDADWGLDARTLSRFQAETTAATTPNESPSRATPPASWLSGPGRTAWLDWRSRQLATFYSQLAQTMVQQKPSARLYLAGARLIESKPIQRAFRPALPRQTDAQVALNELGLDWSNTNQPDSLVFLRPHLLTVDEEASEGANSDFNLAEDVDRYFAVREFTGSQFLHDPVGWRLPTFDELSPFGKNNTYLSLVAQVSPVGATNRRRFARALSAADAQVIFEGGWMLQLGQEETLRQFFEVYRQLPAARFENLVEDERRTQPLQIRALKQNENTFVYVLNDSPWQVEASLRVELPAAATLESLGSTASVEPLIREGEQAVWSLSLKPYDLKAFRVGSSHLRVLDLSVSLPPDVLRELQTRIVSLGSRAAQLRNPPTLKLLENPGFEQPVTSPNSLPKWSLEGDPRAIQLEEHDVYEGKHAVRLTGQGPTVLLRSDPFPPPSSGRLSVSLRAKRVDSQSPPRVRLVLEADGRPYYPWAPIGADDADHALTDEWKEFVFRVSQLPAVESSLKIGVEITGRGSVLIDDVRLFDLLVLDDQEQKALAHILSLADFQLRKGFVADCLRSLNGYWPRYLMAHVAEVAPEVAIRPDTALPQPTETEAETAPSGWNRVKRFMPRLPRF